MARWVLPLAHRARAGNLLLPGELGLAEALVARAKADVSVWDARDHGVELPWRTLRDVLGAVAADNRSRERYLHRVWTRGAVFVAQPDCKPRPACLKRRRLQEADALPSYTRRYDYRGADYLRVPADTLTFFRPVLPFKVGSTEWMRLLLLQQTGRRIATQPNGGGLLSAPKVAYYNASGVERRGGAVERLTFCLVRHPYSRLLSYYLDKLQLRKPKASVMPHTFGARRRYCTRASRSRASPSSSARLRYTAARRHASPSTLRRSAKRAMCTAPGTRAQGGDRSLVRHDRPRAPPRAVCGERMGGRADAPRCRRRRRRRHEQSVRAIAATRLPPARLQRAELGCEEVRRLRGVPEVRRGGAARTRRQSCFYVPRGRDCATALDPPLAQATAGTAAADADAHSTRERPRLRVPDAGAHHEARDVLREGPREFWVRDANYRVR